MDLSLLLSNYLVFFVVLVIAVCLIAIKKIFFSRRVVRQMREPITGSEAVLGEARNIAIKTIAEADSHAVKTIEEADKRAAAMVIDADKKAADIIRSAGAASDNIRKRLDSTLQVVVEKEVARFSAVSAELLTAYRKTAEEAQHAYVRTLEVASNSITGDAREGILKFQTFLNEEMIRQQNLLAQFVQDRRENAQRDIEIYKENSLRKIDESIYSVLLMVSKDVFGRLLDTEEHQALITHALDSAKKENFFTL